MSKSALDEALEIASMEPLPPDVDERIAALEEKASDADKLLFGDIWEIIFMGKMEDGIVVTRK